MGVIFNFFLGKILFAFSSLENSVLLRLKKGNSIRRHNLQNQGLLSFFIVFAMCFCRYCYGIYEPIYHNQQPYHILDMGTQPLGSSIASLSLLLICKFLNNCKTNCRQTASAKNKKNLNLLLL